MFYIFRVCFRKTISANCLGNSAFRSYYTYDSAHFLVAYIDNFTLGHNN